MLTLCVCFRYFWYKDVGLYSLRVARPSQYLWKHFLHLGIAFCLVAIIITFAIGKDKTIEDYVRIGVSVVQIVCWSFSALILRFEYRRALGHVWYMHPVYTWLSVGIYSSDFVYSYYFADSSTESHKQPV